MKKYTNQEIDSKSIQELAENINKIMPIDAIAQRFMIDAVLEQDYFNQILAKQLLVHVAYLKSVCGILPAKDQKIINEIE